MYMLTYTYTHTDVLSFNNSGGQVDKAIEDICSFENSKSHLFSFQGGSLPHDFCGITPYSFFVFVHHSV